MFRHIYTQAKRWLNTAFRKESKRTQAEREKHLPARKTVYKPVLSIPPKEIFTYWYTLRCIKRFHRWMKHHDPRIDRMPAHINRMVTFIKKHDDYIRDLDLPDCGLPCDNLTDALQAIIYHAALTGSLKNRRMR